MAGQIALLVGVGLYVSVKTDVSAWRGLRTIVTKYIIGLSKALSLIDSFHLLIILVLFLSFSALPLPVPIRATAVVIFVDHNDISIVAVII